MSINFLDETCQGQSNRKIFGLCDDPSPQQNPAYIDENDGSKWIAVVVNEDKRLITFTAIDHCITVLRADGKMAKRCDGMLTYNNCVIFVELKQRGSQGSGWVKDADDQLRTSISYFEGEDEADNFTVKKAYISNSEHPKFKQSQLARMNQFFNDTGYLLRIENRILVQ